MKPLLIPLNLLIPIALVIIILIVLLWILYTKNKEIYNKLASEKKKFAYYKQNAESLKESRETPRKNFQLLNNLARDFFKEYFALDYSFTYLELEEKFRELEKEDYAKFCKAMSDWNYSGKEIKKENIIQLTSLFQVILNEY